jgi:hypothetical protein
MYFRVLAPLHLKAHLMLHSYTTIVSNGILVSFQLKAHLC